MLSTTDEQIRLLHLDEDPEFLELTHVLLDRNDNRFSVETATSADDALGTAGGVGYLSSLLEYSAREGGQRPIGYTRII
jgi:hypothetical protein